LTVKKNQNRSWQMKLNRKLSCKTYSQT